MVCEKDEQSWTLNIGYLSCTELFAVFNISFIIVVTRGSVKLTPAPVRPPIPQIIGPEVVYNSTRPSSHLSVGVDTQPDQCSSARLLPRSLYQVHAASPNPLSAQGANSTQISKTPRNSRYNAIQPRGSKRRHSKTPIPYSPYMPKWERKKRTRRMALQGVWTAGAGKEKKLRRY